MSLILEWTAHLSIFSSLYFYSSMILNSGLLLATECFYTNITTFTSVKGLSTSSTTASGICSMFSVFFGNTVYSMDCFCRKSIQLKLILNVTLPLADRLNEILTVGLFHYGNSFAKKCFLVTFSELHNMFGVSIFFLMFLLLNLLS